MKGYRFYLEFSSTYTKSKNKNMGNVVAIDTETPLYENNGMYQGFSSVYDYPDSPVNFGSISPDYLRKNCKRISKEVAEAIHPQLFNRLNS